MNKKQKVAVIGAGIAGLACAYELQKNGFEVTVWEKEPLVGGRMATRHKDGYHFDLGAQMLSNKYIQGRRYAEELGLQWQEMPLHTHIFSAGDLHYASYNSTREFLQFDYLSTFSKARLILFCLYQRNFSPKVDFFDLTTAHDPQLHQLNAYDYTVKWAGKEIADKVFDALCAAYHFHHCRELSLGAMIGLMRMFDLEYIHEYTASQINSLPLALASRLQVHLSTPVKGVYRKHNMHVIETAGGDYSVDTVVFAAPAPATAHILKDPNQRQKSMLSCTHFASTISVSYLMPREPVQHLSLIIVPEHESRIIASFFNQEVKQKTHVQKTGQTLMSVFLRDKFAKQLIGHTNDDIFSVVSQELRRVCPPVKDLSPFDLQRWPSAMPKFLQPSGLLINRFWTQGQGENNIFFCGDWMNAPWIEGALRSGQRVAEMIKAEGRL